MLKQAEERIQSMSGVSCITTKTVMVARNRADRALLVTKSHPQSMLASRPGRGRNFSRLGRFDHP
jgi:hypothetical protein